MEFNQYKDIADSFEFTDSTIYITYFSKDDNRFEMIGSQKLPIYSLKSGINKSFINLNDFEDLKGSDWSSFWVRVLILKGVKQFNFFINTISLEKNSSPVVVKDHINLTAFNILRGKNVDDFGERFPDMSSVYGNRVSEDLKSKYRGGIYLGAIGPIPATNAEEFAYRKMGADFYSDDLIDEAILLAHGKHSISVLAFPHNRESYKRGVDLDKVIDIIKLNDL